MQRPEPDNPSELDLTAIGLRVRQLLAELGVDQTAFSEAIQVPYSTMRAYVSGARPPSPEFLAGAFRVYGASPIWVLTGMGEMRNGSIPAPPQTEEKFVSIPALESPGSGNAIRETAAAYLPAANGFSVPRQWLLARRLDPQSLRVIEVRGESMEDVLFDGDRVLVDLSDTTPRSGYVYVLRQREELLVKYCQLMPEGTLRVSSAKAAYESYEVDLDKTPNVSIVGRVVASMHDW